MTPNEFRKLFKNMKRRVPRQTEWGFLSDSGKIYNNKDEWKTTVESGVYKNLNLDKFGSDLDSKEFRTTSNEIRRCGVCQRPAYSQLEWNKKKDYNFVCESCKKSNILDKKGSEYMWNTDALGKMISAQSEDDTHDYLAALFDSERFP